jgi:hypothetical protein
MLNKENIEFDFGHAKLLKDLAHLKEAQKALKSKFASLSKYIDQPQTPNPCCEHLENKNRLKVKLAGCLSLATAKEGLINEGLVDAPKPKRKRKNKKKKKKKKKGAGHEAGVCGPRRGGISDPRTRGYAGVNNSSYVLFVNCYGHIRARYVGPYEGNVD